VGRRTVAANEESGGRFAVPVRDSQQVSVARLIPGVEERPDIHHNVNEQRRRFDERAQVLTFFP